jgi:hypothetical protein
MSAPLDDIASYSGFVYALRERHPFMTGSTLTLAIPTGLHHSALQDDDRGDARLGKGLRKTLRRSRLS